MNYVLVALVAVLGLVLATLGVQNPSPVTVTFLQFESGAVPLALIMLGSALIGMLLLSLVELPGHARRWSASRHLRHQLSTAETRVAVLQARVPPPVMHRLTEE